MLDLQQLTTVTDIQALYSSWIPEKERGDFFAVAPANYVTGIAAYLSGSPERLSCTLAHVIAMTGYGNFPNVLALLATDETARKWVAPMLDALQAGASQQLAAVIGAATANFSKHVPAPDQASKQRVQHFIETTLPTA